MYKEIHLLQLVASLSLSRLLGTVGVLRFAVIWIRTNKQRRRTQMSNEFLCRRSCLTEDELTVLNLIFLNSPTPNSKLILTRILMVAKSAMTRIKSPTYA